MTRSIDPNPASKPLAAPGPLLEYSSEVRTSRRRAAYRLSFAAVVFLLCRWAFSVVLRNSYYFDRDGVLSDLRTIRNGSVVRVDGFDDGPFWKLVRVKVSLDG